MPQGFRPHAARSAIILDENKKYIAVIFNILVENKKYIAENNSLYRIVETYTAQRESFLNHSVHDM